MRVSVARWVFASLFIGAPAVGSVPTLVGSLELVATDQTTAPDFHVGAFDVYHLVLEASSVSPNTYDLSLPFDSVVPTNESLADALGPFYDSPDLAEPFGFVVPRSFFVTDGGLRLPLNAAAGPDGLETSVAIMDDILGHFGGAVGGSVKVAAVLVVEAGSLRPNLGAFEGSAFEPMFGPLEPGQPIPGDANFDGTVDLLDLDIGFGGSPADLNGDGVRDSADLSIFAANFGASGGGSAAVDAEEFAVFIPTDPTGDGVLDLLDLDALGANFGATDLLGNTLILGDINGDRAVDLLDLDELGRGFVGSAAAIPEPAAIALLAIANTGGLPQRRRGRCRNTRGS